MKYDNEVLRKLQKYELDILKYFIDICDKYEINYFAVYGTVLGAVRHHGFIPWDDDIDVGMLREDFDRFVEAIKREGDNQFEFMNAADNDEFPHVFCKLQLKNTRFEETRNPKYDTGIFIDIFIYDEVSEIKMERRSQIASAKFWRALFLTQKAPNQILIIRYKHLKKIVAVFILTLLKTIIKLFHIKKDYFYKKYMKAALKYRGKKTFMVVELDTCSADRHCFYINDIFPTKTVVFEDIHIKIPCNSEKILEKWYGDYMTLPPLEDRKNHLPFVLKFPEEEELRLKQ